MECDDKEPSAVDETMEVDVEEGKMWKFSQLKGVIDSVIDDDIPSEADMITAIQFSHDGELLATGDRGGRIVIFQQNQGWNTNGQRSCEFSVYSTFQSHEPEFDYLKSLEIEEKINQIKWLKRKNASNFILSTNDKTIKLWKISEREKRVADGNFNTSNVNGIVKRVSKELVLPKLEPMELVVEVSPRRVYANAHAYHVNAISVNPVQDTFISSDDLRINLWHHEITSEVFTIVDLKPTNMEELTEVITSSEYHPIHEYLFAYGSSKGISRICDTRQNAITDKPAKTLDSREEQRGFFSEIVSSLSDIKFSHNGKYLLTRDYLSCHVWDLAMENKPVEVYSVNDYLRSKLCNLYENDSIFDKFEVCWSGDDRNILTGSYHNFFHTFTRPCRSETIFEANIAYYNNRRQGNDNDCPKGRRLRSEINIDNMNFDQKIMHCAYHPISEIVALAASNNLFLYSGSPNKA